MVVGDVCIARRTASRVPNSPHVANPSDCRASQRRTLRRAHGRTKAGSRSVKIFLVQLAVLQKNRGTCRMSCMRKPAQGKSATMRVYWLWRRSAGQKQSGQHDLAFVETTSTTKRSSRMVVVAISNPAGRGRKGDENMGTLQTRDRSGLRPHLSLYHFFPSKRASSKARKS